MKSVACRKRILLFVIPCPTLNYFPKHAERNLVHWQSYFRHYSLDDIYNILHSSADRGNII